MDPKKLNAIQIVVCADVHEVIGSRRLKTWLRPWTALRLGCEHFMLRFPNYAGNLPFAHDIVHDKEEVSFLSGSEQKVSFFTDQNDGSSDITLLIRASTEEEMVQVLCGHLRCYLTPYKEFKEERQRVIEGDEVIQRLLGPRE